MSITLSDAFIDELEEIQGEGNVKETIDDKSEMSIVSSNDTIYHANEFGDVEGFINSLNNEELSHFLLANGAPLTPVSTSNNNGRKLTALRSDEPEEFKTIEAGNLILRSKRGDIKLIPIKVSISSTVEPVQLSGVEVFINDLQFKNKSFSIFYFGNYNNMSSNLARCDIKLTYLTDNGEKVVSFQNKTIPSGETINVLSGSTAENENFKAPCNVEVSNITSSYMDNGLSFAMPFITMHFTDFETIKRDDGIYSFRGKFKLYVPDEHKVLIDSNGELIDYRFEMKFVLNVQRGTTILEKKNVYVFNSLPVPSEDEVFQYCNGIDCYDDVPVMFSSNDFSYYIQLQEGETINMTLENVVCNLQIVNGTEKEKYKIYTVI